MGFLEDFAVICRTTFLKLFLEGEGWEYMRNIFSPDEIPIQFFYFGWKKALSYIKSDYGIYDPIEIENFNRNLHENLLEMRKQFSEGTYNLSSTLTYLLPKSSLVDENQEEKRRVRPMVQFSFRDQVAWATVMLVFSEWFDSNEEIVEIQNSAKSSGENGDEYSIPSKYEKAEVIYKHYYKKGYQQYEEEQKQNQATAAGGAGVIALSWLGRRLYVARKMIR